MLDKLLLWLLLSCVYCESLLWSRRYLGLHTHPHSPFCICDDPHWRIFSAKLFTLTFTITTSVANSKPELLQIFHYTCLLLIRHYSSIDNLQMQFLFIYIVPAYNNSRFQGALHCKVKTLQWACHWRVTILLYSSSSTCSKLFFSLDYYMARSMVHWYSRFQVENKHKHWFFLQLWLYCICFIKSANDLLKYPGK